MKILYLLKQDPDETLKRIMDEHRKANEVTVLDLRTEGDHGRIVELIASNDKVISW